VPIYASAFTDTHYAYIVYPWTQAELYWVTHWVVSYMWYGYGLPVCTHPSAHRPCCRVTPLIDNNALYCNHIGLPYLYNYLSQAVTINRSCEPPAKTINSYIIFATASSLSREMSKSELVRTNICHFWFAKLTRRSLCKPSLTWKWNLSVRLSINNYFNCSPSSIPPSPPEWNRLCFYLCVRVCVWLFAR